MAADFNLKGEMDVHQFRAAVRELVRGWGFKAIRVTIEPNFSELSDHTLYAWEALRDDRVYRCQYAGEPALPLEFVLDWFRRQSFAPAQDAFPNYGE